MAKNNEVRNLILEKAYNLFLLNNFEKVTISKLEKSCEKIRGTIFYYFSNKQELFEAVVDEFFFPSLSLPNEVSEIAVSSSFQNFIKIYTNPEDRIINNIKSRYHIKDANMSCYNFIIQASQYCKPPRNYTFLDIPKMAIVFPSTIAILLLRYY